MKRILALLLVLSMMFCLAACGGNSESASASVSAEASAEAPAEEAPEVPAEEVPEAPQEETPAEEAVPEEAIAEEEPAVDENAPLTAILDTLEPVELPITEDDVLLEVWMAAPGTVSSVQDLANTNPTWAEVQARTGVGITFLMGNFFTQMDDFNLMAAAGDFPAIMNGAANLYASGPDAAIEQEIFLNMVDMLEEYAPNYWAIINSREGLLEDVSTPEGNIIAFYSLYDYAKYGLGDKGYLIRQDWLDKLGLDMPKTYDQLENALTLFKDEMGADSAFTLPTSGMQDFVMGGFGVGSTFYVENGSEIKFGPMEEGFKEYLQLMNKWYESGLIYKDFYSYANEIMFDGTDMIGAGEVALYYNETGTMTSYAEYANDPDFLVKGIAPVTKEEGGTAYMTEFTPTFVDNSRWTITTNCEEPEIAIQVCDYLFSKEGILLCNFGVEGVTFEYVDGKPQFTDLIMNNPDGYAYRDAVALNVIDGAGTVFDPLRGASNYSAEQLSSWDDWTNANLDYSKALPSKEMLNVDEKSEYAALYSDIETFLSEAIIKYIIGDFSFDTYDTDFVGMLESMNIQECIDLYQGALDRYLTK